MEQEFFEAFGIPIHPCNDCLCAKVKNNKIVCTFNNFDNCNRYKEITPEIVLGLIKIISDKGYTFKIFEAEDMFNNGIKYISNAITNIQHDFYGRGTNINYAVLSLCIALKDNIQDDVRALFND